MSDIAPPSSPNLTPTSITEVLQSAYIDYSMSVIVSRALPDARDGLKPVQRRVLYAMLREGLLHNRPYDKCAGVVGEVLKNYHPHGDQSVYDTLVRLAQHWVMRYPLIDPQGNFGSIDGDPPAAYRYTESRLTALTEDLIRHIDEDTVDFAPNYKESTTEPTVLPAALPNLLMNGSTGIAVGMTTNIPPHNLGELTKAVCAVIDNPAITVDELIQHVPGPDFPTGGTIMGHEGILKYMRTGRGIVRVRGTAEVEPVGEKEQIVITEVPYNVNRATLVTRIADLVREKVLDGVADLRDESDTQTRIVLELKRGAVSRVTLNNLYKHTPLESSFGVILLALDHSRPKEMNIKELIECYVEHRREVVFRRTAFRKAKAEARAHILEGYRIALDNLDDFVKIIRASANREEARNSLRAKYPLSEKQVDAILDLRLYQLTGLEREKIEKEYAEIMTLIAELTAILENEQKLLSVIKEELVELTEKYESPRKTRIEAAEGELRMEDIIANESCVVTLSHKGFIKRTPVSQYRSQKRGGKGVRGSGAHEEDFVELLFTAGTHDFVLFFMDNGRVYVEKVYAIPEGARTSKGRYIRNVMEMREDERVAAMICVQDFSSDLHLVKATRKGLVKKTALSDYRNWRRGGLIGINIDEGDALVGVKLTKGDDDLILVTARGHSIRFHETDVRAMGRATRGVKGITLKGDDFVKAFEVADPAGKLLIAAENGLGKRTDIEEYRKQGRGGSGIIAIKAEAVAGALVVHDEDEIMLLTQSGQSVRSPVTDIRTTGRSAQGVRLVNLGEGDRLIGLARVVEVTDGEEEEA